VKQKCQKCGGATIVYQSRATKYGRFAASTAKSAADRRTGGYGNAIRARDLMTQQLY
jgi:hypothetical protein